MIVYSVSLTVDRVREADWLSYMQHVHIPDVLQTGCFLDCRLHRAVDVAADETTYLIQYRCNAIEDYHRYRDQFAPALQKEHTEKFAGSFRASRQILEEVWTLTPASPRTGT